jgi:hypothetical protein
MSRRQRISRPVSPHAAGECKTATGAQATHCYSKGLGARIVVDSPVVYRDFDVPGGHFKNPQAFSQQQRRSLPFAVR